MSATKMYRDQHNDMLGVASEITDRLDAGKLSADASEVRSLLSKLMGKLKIHLAMEDNALYPKLLNSADASVKSLAKKFQDEMGGIGKALDAYKHTWSNALEIQKDPNAFIQQTKELFDALAKRINRENNELYKAADQLS